MEHKFRFPLFVDLQGRRAVVVGGGAIACRRIAVLCAFGAEVTVVSPRLDQSFDGIIHLARPYQAGDLEGAFLAVAATDSRRVNRQVGEDARGLGIFVSVADDHEACTFYFPAVCCGKDVVAGITSQGQAHEKTAAAARLVRRALEELE